MKKDPSSYGVLEMLSKIVNEQSVLVRQFWLDDRFRVPMIVIWVASFGGALHDPVTTFFYLKIGATTTDIGLIGFIRACGVILNPVYGYIQDTYSGYGAMVISALCCAFGCLVRGLATDTNGLFIAAAILGLGASNLWTVVLAHVASNTPPQQRSLVVSGYLFQVSALMILGKLGYTPFNWFLKEFVSDDVMVRYRIAMGICIVFCIFGFFMLILFGGPVRAVSASPTARVGALGGKNLR